MNASMMNAEENQPRLKVSVTARLIAAFAYIIPAIGAAISSMLLMNVFRALRTAESAGIMAVMAGMKESALPLTISLFAAAVFGLVVIVVLIVRMVTETKTASPSIWFFIVSGLLWLIPAGLFWKSQMLVVEALSPGSSISAGGIGGVGGYIAQLLLMSVVATPIVFIILVALSVIPFSSRSKPKLTPIIAAVAIEVLFIAAAVGIPSLIGEPKRKSEIVNLPENVKYAFSDYNIEKESSMVLTLTAENKLYQRQFQTDSDKTEIKEVVITNEQLPEKLKKFLEDKTPDRRIVYLKADVNASYQNVLQVFEIIRKAEISKVGLVVVGEKDDSDPYNTRPKMFEVNLPELIDETKTPVKPNPLTLVAMLEKDGKLKLNKEDIGMISDTKKLENKLTEIFRQREDNGVFREGTNEVETKVTLRVSKSIKYGDFIKLVEAVKVVGAQPVEIQIDDINL